MTPLVRRLPSPAALIAFEAAARHASFTRAAGELNVTQAAVSRQVGNLERRLGVRLFRRAHRAVELTGEGRELQQAVTMGLEHVARAVGELEASAGEQEIAVGATNAFAAFWLMPRLATFRAAHPSIGFRVVTRDRSADFAGESPDLAVVYGAGAWPGLEARHMFGDEVFPVCSPAYAERLGGGLAEPAALLEETLLALEAPQPIWIDWRSWLERVGAAGKPRRQLRFNNYTILVQAALDGQGIGLGWGRLVGDLVRRGHLVRAAPLAVAADHGYHLVWPAGRELEAPARTLRDWILREAGRRP